MKYPGRSVRIVPGISVYVKGIPMPAVQYVRISLFLSLPILIRT